LLLVVAVFLMVHKALTSSLTGKLYGDKAVLSKRYLLETINDQLKNSYVEHTRHRSVNGFMTNMLAGLIAYYIKKVKPSIDLNEEGIDIMETMNTSIV